MSRLTYSKATLAAMREEMRRDDTVFLMGEDIAKQGGIFGQFKGLPEEFGYDRVRDFPISEAVLVSSAVGAAMTGSRPVIDIHFSDFLGRAAQPGRQSPVHVRRAGPGADGGPRP